MAKKPTVITYNEVLQCIGAKKKILLLGNGFSMSYDMKRFSYTSLLQSALDKKIIKKGSPLHMAFEHFETSDFESIIKALENTNKVITVYGYKELVKIKEDSKNLKKYLVDIVTNNHPDKCGDIPDEKYRSAIDFIKDYDKIFTINYDLLLYWTTMYYLGLVEKGLLEDNLDISDGFANGDINDEFVEFLGDPNIMYLHGALHIFDKGHAIIKNTYSRTDIPLKTQTLDNLQKNIYPVFISEGTSEQKLNKINHNSYLNVCFRRLKALSGTKPLIIFGTKLSSGDKHIRDAVIASRCSEIFFPVSFSKQISETPIIEFLQLVSKAKHPKNIIFYDYSTVNVWNKFDN